jgi:hypothetical protein
MPRRLTTVVLAAFYLLQGTWLLHAGMDLLLPPVREAVATIIDSCCTNACGCPEDVRAAGGCCCLKTPAATAREPKTPRPVSALEAARCKGIDDAMTQAFTQPAVSGFAVVAPPVAEFAPVVCPDSKPPLFPRSASLDKVPIGRA